MMIMMMIHAGVQHVCHEKMTFQRTRSFPTLSESDLPLGLLRRYLQKKLTIPLACFSLANIPLPNIGSSDEITPANDEHNTNSNYFIENAKMQKKVNLFD